MANDVPEPLIEGAGLHYVHDFDPGFRRIRCGRGFGYRDPDGNPVRDEAVLERIRRLGIPPAWTDVWICRDPLGHIQATGRDQKRRKQYRYHDLWTTVRDSQKYGRVSAFGRALPRLRARVEADLQHRGLSQEKVLAAVVKVMEITLIRVGNEEYVRQNGHFGLTTLRDEHATITGGKAVFEFQGKSGKLFRRGFQDPRLARVIKACQDLPGQRLFQYVDDEGNPRAVESGDVNAYLREAMGGDFSAKDLRTWAGTMSAARALVMCPAAQSEAEAKRYINTCVKAVAGLLGNTAAVARGSYIHPLILEAYARGDLPLRHTRSDRAFELQVIRFLETARDVAADAAAAATDRAAA
jgi:DNA topoisomerase-1